MSALLKAFSNGRNPSSFTDLPSDVCRVSAFAKRRRINDDSVATASESDGSIAISVVKKVKSTKILTGQLDAKRAVGLVVSQEDPDVASGSGENSFGPLVDANVVSFTGTREIEQIDELSWKIRLSRGQKCAVHGIASLWIREGSICIDGANLDESTRTHTIFFAATGSFTEIIASSKIAEFQLESVSPLGEAYPTVTNVPGKLGEYARRGAASFQVLDQTQTDGAESSDIINDVDTQFQGVPFHLKSTLRRNLAPSRILISGKRSADTYRASTSLVNCLLTYSLTKQNTPSVNEVVFIDLDYTAPAFSAPGTISVALLERPIFGPSYTRPLTYAPTTSNRLVAAQYIKAVENTVNPRLNVDQIKTLLEPARQFSRNACVVIRTGPWLAHTKSSERSLLQKILQIDLAICIDSRKSSLYYEATQFLSNPMTDSFLHLPVSPCATPSLLEHKLMLQSHFRLRGYVNDTPLWYRDPLSDGGRHKLVLSTSKPKNQVKFLHVRGGVLRPQDIPNALHQNLVVIVAMPGSTESETEPPTTSPNPTPNHNENVTTHPSLQHGPKRPLLDFREPQESQTLHFVGLAYVEDIDVEASSIALNTPVSIAEIQRHGSMGREVGLVLEKAGVDGRFGRHLLFG